MADQVFGDDIEIGDEVGPLVKSPDLAQVQAFVAAWRRPEGAFLARFTDQAAASRDGFNSPIVPGPLSLAFLSQLLTDWAGPRGRLRSLEVNYRRPTRHGEELKCVGLVVDKREAGEEAVIRLDVYIEDPRGDRPTQGVAEVVLPAAAP